MRCDWGKSKSPKTLAFVQGPTLPPPLLRKPHSRSHPKPLAPGHPPSQAGLLPPILPCFPHSSGPLSPAFHRATFASHLGPFISLISSHHLSVLQFTLVATPASRDVPPLLSHAPGISSGPLTTLSLLRRRLSLSLNVPQGFLLPFLNSPHNLTHSKSPQSHT